MRKLFLFSITLCNVYNLQFAMAGQFVTTIKQNWKPITVVSTALLYKPATDAYQMATDMYNHYKYLSTSDSLRTQNITPKETLELLKTIAQSRSSYLLHLYADDIKRNKQWDSHFQKSINDIINQQGENASNKLVNLYRLYCNEDYYNTQYSLKNNLGNIKTMFKLFKELDALGRIQWSISNHNDSTSSYSSCSSSYR